MSFSDELPEQQLPSIGTYINCSFPHSSSIINFNFVQKHMFLKSNCNPAMQQCNNCVYSPYVRLRTYDTNKKAILRMYSSFCNNTTQNKTKQILLLLSIYMPFFIIICIFCERSPFGKEKINMKKRRKNQCEEIVVEVQGLLRKVLQLQLHIATTQQ